MKKARRVFLIIVIIIAIMMASSPLNVLAKPDSSGITTNPLIAGGTWTTGNEVDVTSLAASAPQWLQLLANGVKVTEAGKICHPFRGGQFGWVGEIRQYKDGEGIKLPTTNDWVPSKEGEFMSCAQAPAAGTYALFGYWIRLVVTVVEVPSFCSSVDWDEVMVTADGNILISGYVYNISVGTAIHFTVTDYFPTLPVPPLTGSSTVGSDNYFNIDTGISGGDYSSVTFTIYEESHNCQYENSVVYTAD